MIKVDIRCCTRAAVPSTSKNMQIATALNFHRYNAILYTLLSTHQSYNLFLNWALSLTNPIILPRRKQCALVPKFIKFQAG